MIFFSRISMQTTSYIFYRINFIARDDFNEFILNDFGQILRCSDSFNIYIIITKIKIKYNFWFY